MMAKAPNKFLVPIMIAGITVGFLASARRFIFAKPKAMGSVQSDQNAELGEENIPTSLKK